MRPYVFMRTISRRPRFIIIILVMAIFGIIFLSHYQNFKCFIVEEYYSVFRPDFTELISEGNKIVDEVKRYETINGKYPDELTQTQGIHRLKLNKRYGGWQYENRGNHFRLRIGDYGKYCWEVKYSSSADGDGWYVDT